MKARDSMHLKVQRNGKKRDFGICQICGSNENAEGHHMVDYQFGGAADVENIMTLCRKCHKQVHRGKIDLIKF